MNTSPSLPLHRFTTLTLALLVLTLLCGFFFWRVLTPEARDRLIFAQDGDFMLHYQAPIALQVERVQQGALPLWNPYNNAGEPLAANIQYNTLYPVRYLLALTTDTWDFHAYQREVIFHYWLASVAMFLFLRAILPESTEHSALAVTGGVLYAYSGFLTAYPMVQPNMVNTMAWLPLVLLGIHHSFASPVWRIRAAVLSALCAGLMILGGHPQLTFYALVLVICYALRFGMTPRTGFVGSGWRLAILGGLGTGIAAIQLLPMIELAAVSDRVNDFAYLDKSGGIDPQQIRQFIWPNADGTWSPLYTGVVALIFAAGALARQTAGNRFWIAVLLVGLLLAMGGNSVLYDALYIVAPGFDLFRNQERVMGLVMLALVMLAVIQIHWLLSPPSSQIEDSEFRPRRTFDRITVALVALLGGAFLLSTMIDTGTANQASQLAYSALIGGLLLLWLHWQRDTSATTGSKVAVLLIIIVLDLFSLGGRSSNFVPDTNENRLQLPPALADYAQINDTEITWRVDGATGLRSTGAYFRVADIYGANPVTLDAIDNLRQLPVDRLWEVLSVRYVTTSDEPPPEAALELVAYERSRADEEFRVFELVNPRPVAHLVYDSRHAEGDAVFVRQIMSDPRIDLREIAVTLNPLPVELSAERPESAVIDEFQFASASDLSMQVTTPENALLTLSIVDYPGWRATINGESADIIRVNAGLIGLVIPPGEAQAIHVWMVSETVNQGALLTGLALFVGALLMTAEFWVRRRREQPTAGTLPAPDYRAIPDTGSSSDATNASP